MHAYTCKLGTLYPHNPNRLSSNSFWGGWVGDKGVLGLILLVISLKRLQYMIQSLMAVIFLPFQQVPNTAYPVGTEHQNNSEYIYNYYGIGMSPRHSFNILCVQESDQEKKI